MNSTSWRFDLAPVARDSRVYKDGEDISSQVRAVTIRAAVGEMTRVVVEYVNVEAAVDAEVE